MQSIDLCNEIAEGFLKKRGRPFPQAAYNKCLASESYRRGLVHNYTKLKPPSLLRAAVNYVRAETTFAVHRLKAPESLQQSRAAICEPCAHLKGGKCELCRCGMMNRKRKMALERCPRDFWDVGWRVAVTTAPREEYYLDNCLDSLLAAGWSHPRIFADHNSPISSRADLMDMYPTPDKLGAWRNFYRALEWAMQGEYALLVQDDAVLIPELRWYLERELWPRDDCGLILLIKSRNYNASKRGWVRLFPDSDTGIIGAWGLLMRPEAARDFFNSDLASQWPAWRNHRDMAYPSCVDMAVGQWFASQDKWSVWTHAPSLGQHEGQVSAIGRHPVNSAKMTAESVFEL